MYANMSASNFMSYVSELFTFFKLAYYIKFLFNIDHLLSIFHLDCIRWCRFSFIPHAGKKSQCLWRGNQMRCMIISPK